MKIYYVHHSLTADNEEGLVSGWNDVPLSPLGVQQSLELADRFIGMEIDLICCSDLVRTIETARIAFGRRVPVMTDKRLRGVDYGDFNSYPDEIVEPMRKEKISVPFPNGESYSQAVQRTQGFFLELQKICLKKAVALVIGHHTTRYSLDILSAGKTLEQNLLEAFDVQECREYDI